MADVVRRPSKRSGKANASLVVGMLSILLWMTFFPAIIAIVLGLLARAEIRRANGDLGGSRVAGWGLALGLVSLVGGAVVAFIFLGGFTGELGA